MSCQSANIGIPIGPSIPSRETKAEAPKKGPLQCVVPLLCLALESSANELKFQELAIVPGLWKAVEFAQR